MSPSPLYKIENLSFDYPLGNTQVRALKDVNLVLPAQKLICLTGPSGSGKSTLLSLLGLIEPVQTGAIYFQSQNLTQLTEPEKNALRRHKIGFIFQHFQLFPVLSAFENVEYLLTRQKISRPERATRVEEALRAVGLWEHRQKRPPQMSGGQRQRVAIARAIAKRPQVLIADEPTASLDQSTGRDVMDIFKTLNKSLGFSIVVSSHDPMVLPYADYQIQLRDGSLQGGRS